jgi:transcriptional regulator with XRE-family HTH domain
MQLAVRSGCAIATLRKIERMDPEVIGQVKIKSLMKAAACLECSPADLVPFLTVTVKRPKASGS